MKKAYQYITLIFLLISNVPVQAMSLNADTGQENADTEQKVGATDLVETTNETSKEEIDSSHELQESSEQKLETEDSLIKEAVQVQENSESPRNKQDGSLNKFTEDSQTLDSYDFSNSQTINGINYEWNWDLETKHLDFNANNGNSLDVIQVMRDNNLMDVHYLIIRNLNEITQLFQMLNDLVTIEFYDVTTLATAAFQGLPKLQEVTFNNAINIGERAFQECSNLVKVNNSLNMVVIKANAFNGTAIEELEVGVEWQTGLADSLSLNGMNSLRQLVNHGGGVNSSDFLGAVLPALEVYEGIQMGAAMSTHLTNFLNSRVPNLKKVSLHTNLTSNSYTFDRLDLRNVPSLEEFIYEHTDSPGEYALGQNAFQGLEHLRTVRIDGITRVGNNAFRDTPNLEEVLLNRVNRIDDRAFSHASSLKTVSAPQLKTMGQHVFVYTGLEEIYFPELEETSHYPFERNSYLRKADLPKLRLAGFQLFAYCPALEEVNLPSLERINHADFTGSQKLKSIYLPAAVSVSGNQNFWNSGLESIVLPKMDLSRFHNNTFGGSSSLRYLEVAYANDANRFNAIIENRPFTTLQVNEQIVFGDEYSTVFDSNNSIEKVVLKKTTHIGNAMFKNMTSLKEIEAPKLIEIGDEAFRNTELASLYFPELESVGAFAFAETSSLMTVTMNKLNTLGNSAFLKSRVEKIEILQIKELPDAAFEKCTRLKEVIMPKVESIGSKTFSDTKSLKILPTDEVKEIGDSSFFNSGIEYLNLPKLALLGQEVFQGTENLLYLNLPVINEILAIDNMFNLIDQPYGVDIPLPTIHGIDTSMRNKSGIETIMTLDENREIVKPLTEDLNDRILAISTDGSESIESDSIVNFDIGNRVDISVRSNIIINDSIDNIKADLDYIWKNNGISIKHTSNLLIEEVMPWHNGIYYRQLVVNSSRTNKELFSYHTNTITLNVHYENQLDVAIWTKDPEITIGDSTIVTATIENISGYGDVEVSIELVTGLIGGIKLVENSISSGLNGNARLDNFDFDEIVIIPQQGKLELTFEVLGVNNESIENNLQIIVTELTNEGEKNMWAGANRLIVNNGRLRFNSPVTETIDFNQWDALNPLLLGSITTQLKPFNLEVQDLRGTNEDAHNEIQGNRSNWRAEVITDNIFRDETGQESVGLLQLLVKNQSGIWHNASNGIPIYTHETNNEMPLSDRYHSFDVGNKTQLGIMLNQLTGLIENSTYSVDMTFDLVDAP